MSASRTGTPWTAGRRRGTACGSWSRISHEHYLVMPRSYRRQTMSTSEELRHRGEALRESLPPRRSVLPPEENGERLGTIARDADTEIRVNWAHHEGHPYVAIRAWNRDRQTGYFWPDKHRGLSIRLRELPDLAAA